MRVRCMTLLDGPGPAEQIVAVPTANGAYEEVVVHRNCMIDGALEVAAILDRGDQVLVELPRESTVGNWRLWVEKEDLVQ